MQSVIQHLRNLCYKKLLPITAISNAMQNIDTSIFKSSIKYHSENPARNILYIDEKMSLHTLGFMPNQYLPMQDYGRFNVFFVVLDGEIIEYVHVKPHLMTRHFVHKTGSGHYINEFIGYNQFYNKSDTNTGILQLFVA
jgi:hypothetical protein